MNDFSTDQIHRRDVDRTIRRGTWVVPIVSYIFLHALTSWLLFLSGSLPTSLSFSSLEINFFLSLFLLGRLARTTQVSQGAALIWKAYLPMRFHRWRYSNSPEFSFNAIYMTHRVPHHGHREESRAWLSYTRRLKSGPNRFELKVSHHPTLSSESNIRKRIFSWLWLFAITPSQTSIAQSFPTQKTLALSSFMFARISQQARSSDGPASLVLSLPFSVWKHM